jgi:hypothetical protein
MWREASFALVGCFKVRQAKRIAGRVNMKQYRILNLSLIRIIGFVGLLG